MELYNRLEAWFTRHPKVLVALSGGVDSSLLAYMARKVLGRENGRSVIGVSHSLKSRDLDGARSFCKRYDISLTQVNPGEMDNPAYNTNPVNRCYFCKTALYDTMKSLVARTFADYVIVNGNNTDDISDYRPGKKAAEERNVFSPLADCDFTKEDIRKLAKALKLEVWNKPASPCLSSRVAYGEMITIEKLKKIEQAENFLLDSGFSDVRVRYYPNKILIEVPKSEIPELKKLACLESEMQRIGLNNWQIDKEGLVSGKLNKYAMISPNDKQA